MILEVFDYEKGLSPITVFQVIREKFGAPTALLESVMLDEKNKFSIIAFAPIQEIITKENSFEKISKGISKSKKFPQNFHFSGGLIGYFNFEIFNEIESNLKKTAETPNALFYEFSRFFIFDHEKQQIFVIQTTKGNKDFSEETAKIFNKAKDIKVRKTDISRLKTDELADFSKFDSQLEKDDFFEKVNWAKQKIMDGEIFQIIVSNQFSAEIGEKDGLDFYTTLRDLEPTTHLFFLDFGAHGQVCGASPEILGSKRGKKVLYSPIAGTRFRGKTELEDQALLEEMKLDPKENAEHDMLVDLGRNDLGKICNPGSIKIIKEKYARKFANLMHLVSDIEGEIDSEKYDAIEFFKAIFPAGTLTGAPKIRAIELIRHLEKVDRDLYGGAVGYFSADGDMEFCIAIRSFFCKDGTMKFRTGAGIVQDSKPEDEWLEVHNKAKSLCKIFNYVQKDV